MREKQVTALLGRPLSDAERADFTRARAVWQLREKKRLADWHARGPMTATERTQKRRARLNDIFPQMQDAIANIDWKRRLASQKSPRAFIRAYCCGEGGFLEYEPFKRTDEILDAMWSASDARVPYHIRMTRSGGKTSLMMCLCGHRIVNALSMFCVFTASKAKPQATDMADDMWTFLEGSPNLLQDYPEVCLPIRLLDGSPQKARTQKFNGRRTNCRKSEHEIVLPTIDIKPPPCVAKNGKMPPLCARVCKVAVKNLCGKQSGGIILANGFDAKIRGLRKGKRRPDLILLDDLQDDEMAASPEQVEKARKKIYKSYFKLGSQKRRPSILMTSTPISPGDLSEIIAEDRNWKTQTFRMMDSMPSDAAMKLWERYKAIRDTAPVGEHPETLFYVENRAAMDEGAAPFWEENFSPGDGEVSAIQHAMNAYLEDPESFESEYQMKPRRASSVYELSPQVVIGATNGHPMGVVPEICTRVIAAIDVMSGAGLRYVLKAFGPGNVAAVIGFGRYPADGRPLFDRLDPIEVKEASVARAVAALLGQFKAARYAHRGGGTLPVSCVGIDAGWLTRTISAVTSTFADGWIYTMRGVSWQKFSPYTRAGRLASNVISAAEFAYRMRGKWGVDLCFHSDYFAETSQRAWMVPQLQRGSTSIFDARPDELIGFANEIVADHLVSKSRLVDGSSETWKWATNGANHFGDCDKMATALAYWKRLYLTSAESVRGDADRDRSASVGSRPRVRPRRKSAGISVI